MPPLETLFGIVDKKLGAFSKDKRVNNIVAALDWYVEHDLFQQGITMLQEGIVTIILKEPKNYGNKKLRDACSYLLGSEGTLAERLKYSLEKNSKLSENEKETIQMVAGTDLFSEFREFFDQIRDLRNDLNHGGFLKGRKEAKTFIQELKKLSSRFKSVLRSHNLLESETPNGE
jgi:hypothetical protein